MKKTGATVTFLIVFCSIFTLISVAPAQPQYAAYINADGSIDGTNKIVRDGNVYTLTGDISGGIKVGRNSTVLDGAGFTLQGNGEDGWGVDIATLSSTVSVFNVTVKNLRIMNFGAGVRAVFNCTVVGNYINGCAAGIDIMGGSNITIMNNTITNNGNPVSIAYSGGNHVITRNNIINGTTIIVWLSPEPSVFMNYWGNYNGTDADSDGIGDSPYLYINTDYAKYIDRTPLMEPAETPILIPEFSSWIFLVVMLVAFVVVTAIFRHNLHKQH